MTRGGHHGSTVVTPVFARRIRFSILLAVLSALSFYVGTHLFPGAAGARVHVLTGRPIAGIATDAGWLDRETRSVEETPDEALALIGIRPGMIVADVGAGSGYMTNRLARLVGPSGRVYANDLQPAMLRIIEAKATAERLPNIVLVRGTETETNLPAGGIDLALLVDVYHELSHPQEMLQSIRRALKDDGRLVLVEYRKEDSSIPVIPTHRMSAADLKAEVGAEGFKFDGVVSTLPRQHIVGFRR
jgi:predicted methyltransferase